MEYGLILLILIIAARCYARVALHCNITDIPDHRSSHDTPIITGGGVLFLLAVWLFFVGSGFTYPYLILAVSIIGVISFIDDLHDLGVASRLPFQFLAILLVLVEADMLNLPWWWLPVLLIGGVGFINSYNFMDGINGINVLYSFVVIAGFYLLNTKEALVNSDLLHYLILSLLVFGFYNFRRKACFFGGDIGSMTIAVILFYLGILFVYKLQTPLVLLLVAVYTADATVTVFYRMAKGEAITTSHRLHIFQKLVDTYGYSHLSVAMSYALVQLTCNYLVYQTYLLPLSIQYMILGSAVAFFIVLYWLLFVVISKTSF